MSHIETGNTKLSLPVLVDISQALDVYLDDLVFDHPLKREKYYNELSEILETCTDAQIQIITDMAKSIKISMQKHKHE